MNYQEVLGYLYQQLPMYQRSGKVAYKKDLGNIKTLCAHLNHPQQAFKSIHIAGSNGKGSIAHGLSAILQEEGYKVGLYTSPHLIDFRERIRLNGELVTKQIVQEFVVENMAHFNKVKPSFFEWSVALAFHVFRKEQVDVAVVETGLGGRLDSTNVITPELSIISNISLDHVDLLGDSLSQIAGEKAGIIKENVPVVIGNASGQKEVFIRKAKSLNAAIHFADEEENVLNIDEQLPSYQHENFQTIGVASKILIELGWKIDLKMIPNRLSRMNELTGLRGRWQVMNEHPRVIFDTAHNEAGIKHLVQTLAKEKVKVKHLVIGFVKGKDLGDVLKQLPKEAKYYFCSAKIDRSLAANELKEEAVKFGLEGDVFESPEAALEKAKREAKAEDLILAFGSNFMIGELLENI